jgi:two-component system phosphate regulon sensor histidine kinase PhoR
MWVQYLWISNAVDLKHKELDVRLKKALEEIQSDIEEYYYCFTLHANLQLDHSESFYILRQGATEHDSWYTDTLATYFKRPDSDSLYPVGAHTFGGPVTASIQLNFEFNYEKALQWQDTLDEMRNWIIDSYSSTLIDPETKFRVVDTVSLAKLVGRHMEALGVGEYVYCIYRKQDSLPMYCGGTAISQSNMNGPVYEASLYDELTSTIPYRFILKIGDLNELVVRNLWMIIASSAAVIIVLIVLFVFFLKVMIKQRKLNVMKSDFINNMTHEFNTPVSNINLALDTIDKQGPEVQPNGLLTIIREENKRIQENIARILQTTTVEKQMLSLTVERVDLKDIIERVVASFQMCVNESGGEITTVFYTEDTYLQLDEVHFINLLYNLLDNAIKYSLNEIAIQVAVKKVAGGLAVTVSDRGMGIKEDEKERIFDRFYRVSTGKVHDVKGFGLGLHYVKQVVTAHGWKIELKSKPGKGSSFVVLIPNQN